MCRISIVNGQTLEDEFECLVNEENIALLPSKLSPGLISLTFHQAAGSANGDLDTDAANATTAILNAINSR